MNTDCSCGVIIESPKENQIVVNLNSAPAVNIANGAIPLLSEYAKYYEEILEARDNVVNLVAHKQDKLIAGNNISINGNVISATNSVPAETIQQITDNQNAIAQQQREIDALIRMQGGQIYNFEKQETEAHEITVPSGAKMCDVLEVNGRSYVANQTASENIGVFGSSYTLTKTDGVYTQTILKSDNVIQFRFGNVRVDYKGGHKYLLVCEVKPSINCDFKALNGGTSYVTPSAINCPSNTWSKVYFIYSPPSDDYWSGYVTPSSTLQAGDTIQYRNPMLIDLTKAGLEGLTVEQCRKAFADYIPYNEGALESVKTDKVISKGKNVRDEEYVLTTNERGYYLNCERNTTYTVSLSQSTTGIYIRETDRTEITHSYNAKIFTFNSGEHDRIIVAIYNSSGVADDLWHSMQIEKGNAPTSYSAPFETTVPILTESAIATLDCYGAGIGDVTNRIYQQDGKWYYEQNFKEINLDNLSFTLSSTSAFYYCPLSAIPDMPTKGTSSNIKVLTTMDNLTRVIKIANTNIRFYVTSTVAPSGKMIYELAEPITTDITDLIEAQAFKVEAGGTITLHNTDESSVPIKNTLEYATLLKEVSRYE